MAYVNVQWQYYVLLFLVWFNNFDWFQILQSYTLLV